MQRVHFIAIGGSAMHNLAIAISKKENIKVTGSDEKINEPSLSRLKQHNLLPDKLGWFPDRISKGLNAVIVGMHTTADNPELLRAKELSLKIYSFPEFLFQQTRSKTRIVVGGSHGKTTTTAMILFVLKKLKIDTDYFIGPDIEGFDTMVKITYEARIAVFEGDEYMTSPIDRRAKFHLYKPHIAILTGIDRDQINIFPTFEMYFEQFEKFAELMEMQGRLIYYDGDENLRKIAEKLRRDMVAFPYNTPEYEIRNGITYIKTRKGEVPLKVFGEHNLQNLNAARLACRQIGVYDDQFFSVISEFSGIANRLQKIVETNDSVAFKDSAHSPSSLKANIHAVKTQFPDKKLITCIELHTFSSLTEDYLPQYKDSIADVESAFIYIDPQVIEQKNLKKIDADQVKSAFGGKNTEVFYDIQALKQKLSSLDYDNSALLFMSSGNFSGLNLLELSQELLKK